MKTKLFIPLTNVRKFSNLIIDTSKINAKEIKYILPSIHHMNEVLALLNLTLSNLDSSNFYLLEFCLFLHTNDKDLKMRYIDSGIGSIYSDEYQEDAIYITALSYIKSKYKINGYANVDSYLFNLDKLDIELEDFILNIYEDLMASVTYKKPTNIYFECERPLVLLITKL
jgi:hypothetical protein